jgi:hypothetical protein
MSSTDNSTTNAFLLPNQVALDAACQSLTIMIDLARFRCETGIVGCSDASTGNSHLNRLRNRHKHEAPGLGSTAKEALRCEEIHRETVGYEEWGAALSHPEGAK